MESPDFSSLDDEELDDFFEKENDGTVFELRESEDEIADQEQADPLEDQ